MTGLVSDEVVQNAARHDLLVVGARGASLDGGQGLSGRHLPHQLLGDLPVPMLVTPGAAPALSHAVVAFDGSSGSFRALAVAAMGISVASMILPPLVGMLLAWLDWRLALALLALGLLVCLWILVLAGIPAHTAAAQASGRGAMDGALMYRRAAFWLIGLCVALGLNASLVLGICYPPHFLNQGYTVAEAGWFMALTGLAGMTGKGVIAWLGDAGHHYARWVAAALLLLQTVGIQLLLAADSAVEVLPAMAVIGFGAGAFVPMHPYLNSRYFDAANIGQVSGAQMPLFLPFGLAGAPLAGYAYDQLGNYHLVLQCLGAALVVAAALAIALPGARGVPVAK